MKNSFFTGLVALFLLFTGCKKDKVEVTEVFDLSEGQTNWTKIPYWDYAVYNDNAEEEFDGMFMYDIDFIDGNTGYLVGYREGHEPSRRIYRTIDGGQTWMPVQQGDCGAGSFNLCVLAPSPDKVFIGTRCMGAGILHSENGETWELYYSAPYTSNPFPELHGMHFGENALHLCIGTLRTLDGGTEWEFMNLPSGTRGYSFGHASEGVCVTADGGIHRTIDDGDTWSLLYDTPGNLEAIVQPEDNVIVGGGSGIFRSVDNGASWAQVSSRTGIVDIRFVDEHTGFAAAGDRILKTTDGGQSWDVNYTSKLLTFRRLEVVNSTTVVAVGDQPKNKNLHMAYYLQTTTLGE